MMLRRLVGAAIFLPVALGQNCAEEAACAGDGKTCFHHNPEIPWGYSPKARTASTGKPKEVAVQKDTEAA